MHSHFDTSVVYSWAHWQTSYVFIVYQKDAVENYWPGFLNLSSVCQHEIAVLKGNLITENPMLFEITLLLTSPCLCFKKIQSLPQFNRTGGSVSYGKLLVLNIKWRYLYGGESMRKAWGYTLFQRSEVMAEVCQRPWVKRSLQSKPIKDCVSSGCVRHKTENTHINDISSSKLNLGGYFWFPGEQWPTKGGTDHPDK